MIWTRFSIGNLFILELYMTAHAFVKKKFFGIVPYTRCLLTSVVGSCILPFGMNIEFSDHHLKRLFFEPSYNDGRPEEIVKAFRKRIQFIRQAPDERAFREMKSLHYEKLRKSDQRSMRLNNQFRLVMRVKIQNATKSIIIDSIEDYH